MPLKVNPLLGSGYNIEHFYSHTVIQQKDIHNKRVFYFPVALTCAIKAICICIFKLACSQPHHLSLRLSRIFFCHRKTSFVMQMFDFFESFKAAWMLSPKIFFTLMLQSWIAWLFSWRTVRAGLHKFVQTFGEQQFAG